MELKLRYFENATLCFDERYVMSKKRKIDSNFGAFSQCLNFKKNIDRIPNSIEVLQTYLLILNFEEVSFVKCYFF